jgi:hypothetical protein
VRSVPAGEVDERDHRYHPRVSNRIIGTTLG